MSVPGGKPSDTPVGFTRLGPKVAPTGGMRSALATPTTARACDTRATAILRFWLAARASASSVSSAGSLNTFHHSPRGSDSAGRAVFQLPRSAGVSSLNCAGVSTSGRSNFGASEQPPSDAATMSARMSFARKNLILVRGSGEGLDLRDLAMLFERAIAGELAQHDIEHRREKQSERGDADHSREDRDAHCLTHFRSRARRKRERYHSHAEAERRPQDGTQPQPA